MKPSKTQMAITALALAAALLLVLQIGFYLRVISHPPQPGPDEHFDLLAVFGGDPARAQLALTLARQGRGDNLVISDAGTEKVAEYLRDFGPAGTVRILAEPYARTTDENARLVGRIIRAQGFHRVLLITSWYHQPRSYLLLRLALIHSGVTLRMLSVEPAPEHFYATPEFQEEVIKFWGSLARWAKSILRRNGLYPGESPLPVD